MYYRNLTYVSFLRLLPCPSSYLLFLPLHWTARHYTGAHDADGVRQLPAAGGGAAGGVAGAGDGDTHPPDGHHGGGPVRRFRGLALLQRTVSSSAYTVLSCCSTVENDLLGMSIIRYSMCRRDDENDVL